MPDTEIAFEPTDVKRRAHISFEVNLVGAQQPGELLTELTQAVVKHGHEVLSSEASLRS